MDLAVTFSSYVLFAAYAIQQLHALSRIVSWQGAAAKNFNLSANTRTEATNGPKK